MIDVRFHKTLTSEYMIIPSLSSEVTVCYEEQIFHNNTIDGFLDFSLREYKGTPEYYYNIQGLIKASDLWQSKSMDSYICHKLFEDIGHGLKMIETYLLSSHSLCLDMDFIYYHREKQCYAFTYIPGYESPLEEQVRELLAWLMKHMSYENKAIVQQVFDLYKILEENVPVGTLFFGFLDKQENDSNQQYEKEDVESYTDFESNIDLVTNLPEAIVEEQFSWQSWICPIILTAVPGMLSLICARPLWFWLRKNFNGNIQPWMISCLFIGASLAIFIVGLVRYVSYKNNEDGAKDDFWQEEKAIDYTQIRSSETTALEGEPHSDQTRALGQSGLVLYPKDEAMEPISVLSFPFTIGKNKAVVQHCIPSPVVSRRHIQICKELDGIYITDLHSTNGTKLNCISMVPDKAYKINRQDVVRIANIEYDVKLVDDMAVE